MNPCEREHKLFNILAESMHTYETSSGSRCGCVADFIEKCFKMEELIEFFCNKTKRKKRFVQYVCKKEDIEFCDAIKNVEIIWMRQDCAELFDKMDLHEMIGIVYVSFEYKNKAEDVVLKVTRVK